MRGHFDLASLIAKVGAIEGVSAVITPLPFGAGGRQACIFERDGAHHYILALVDAPPFGETRVRRWSFEARFDRVELVDTWEGPWNVPPPLEFLPSECLEVTSF